MVRICTDFVRTNCARTKKFLNKINDSKNLVFQRSGTFFLSAVLKTVFENTLAGVSLLSAYSVYCWYAFQATREKIPNSRKLYFLLHFFR